MELNDQSLNISITKLSSAYALLSLVALRVPQLEHDDEGDDEELQHHSQDAQRHVLDGDHLRSLVLEEEGPAALGDSGRRIGGSNQARQRFLHKVDKYQKFNLPTLNAYRAGFEVGWQW